MKNQSIYLAIICMLFSVLSACTVEKRHYTKGYHIEWLSSKKQSTDRQTSPNEQQESFTNPTVAQHATADDSPNLQTPEESAEDTEYVASETDEIVVQKKKPRAALTKTAVVMGSDTTKQVLPLALTAKRNARIATNPFFFGGSLIFMLFQFYISQFVLLGVMLWLMISEVIALVALVQGIIARTQIRHSPDQYTGLKEANRAIIRASIGLVLIPLWFLFSLVAIVDMIW